ncbi:MAG: murein L,D-transpeptidase catalytic domain-containing protein [Longimicrobiales bacterium]
MSKPVQATPVASVVLFVAAILFSALPAASADRIPSSVPADTGRTRTTSPIKVLGTPVDVPPAIDARVLATESALAALAPVVGRTSTPDALRQAFQAYHNHRAAHPDEVANPYFYFVDFGLDNATPRGWVFDMERLELVEGPFTVAHGRGSLKLRNGIPRDFSNRPGSYQSSLGLYVAQETYTFRGTAGGRRYSSIGLRMRGESGSFNSVALQRGIVAHGAPYVTASAAGRSEGCPAMEQQRARRLLPLLANGGIVFIYSPNDDRWLGQDPWVNAD